MTLTRDQANEIKRLAGLYAGAPYLAAYSQEFVDAQAALHHYIDSLVGVDAAPLDADHIYRLREQIARDTDTIYTLRGLLSLARDALADCLDDAPTADQLSVSGGVYEGVAAKSAIRAIDEALERTQ